MALPPLEFKGAVRIEAPPARVQQAFFAEKDLAMWWDITRSLTMPRILGTYAVEWAPAETVDRVLGQLGGTLHGRVLEFTPGRELFLADLYWHPPEGDPVGPMALEISCRPIEPMARGAAVADGPSEATELRVRQSAQDDGVRIRRYFAVTSAGWTSALETLKDYVENEWLYDVRKLKVR